MSSDRGGFGLLEVLVALTITGMVSLAALATLSAQSRVTRSMQGVLHAHELATIRVAELRLMTAAQLDALPADTAVGQSSSPDFSVSSHVRRSESNGGSTWTAVVRVAGPAAQVTRSVRFRPAGVGQ